MESSELAPAYPLPRNQVRKSSRCRRLALTLFIILALIGSLYRGELAMGSLFSLVFPVRRSKDSPDFLVDLKLVVSKNDYSSEPTTFDSFAFTDSACPKSASDACKDLSCSLERFRDFWVPFALRPTLRL